MKRIRKWLVVLLTALLALAAFAGCGDTGDPSSEQSGPSFTEVETENKELSKEEYVSKTLGGLLGQFAGFLSGYEFFSVSGGAYNAHPEYYWTSPYGTYEGENAGFLNGPYAGNYTYNMPGDSYRYDRHQLNEETGMYEVWSDDDYHIDIFNQSILEELGASSYAIKETWKKYQVSDWGGGGDAMMLINSSDMLAPFTGSIEGGNRYGWCTEAYIENETLGMNAAGMPNVATELTDKFASNVGYYDSVIWAKFYAAMYSLAYFETDAVTVMEKALPTLPAGSWPRRIYDLAVAAYEQYPNDYRAGAEEFERNRIPLYRLDNRQTDPNINGGFAVLSILYGDNSYLDTCKYASLLGYDGDCTAAIVTGLMGVLKGFEEGNEEYEAINDVIYYDGEGVYYNDRGLYDGEPFTARILSEDYFTRIKIDEIVDMYRRNFEKILVANGGTVEDDSYIIPTTPLYADHSLLFENYDAEQRTTEGFTAENGTLSCYVDGSGTENGEIHAGYAAFRLENGGGAEAYHTFENLTPGRSYRLAVYVKTQGGGQVSVFARDGSSSQEISFAGVRSLTNKEFIFTATSAEMEVGFRFADSAADGDVLTFDDFMLEEIEREVIAEVSDQELTLASNQYLKTIAKPAGVAEGEEVILSVEYRNYSGAATLMSVSRNNTAYGGVMLSNTSSSSLSGSAYIEIPYLFSSDSDVVRLSFDGSRMYIGSITIYRQTQYMFR